MNSTTIQERLVQSLVYIKSHLNIEQCAWDLEPLLTCPILADDFFGGTRLETVQKAHTHRIIGSAVYDSLVIMGLLMIAGFIAVGLHKVVTGEDLIEHSIGFQLYLVCIIGSYFFYFWKHSGQTVGMKAWRLKLISQNDNKLTYTQLFLRFLMAIPAYGCLLLGVFWQYWDHSGLNWHDKISKTRLVHLPKT